MKLSIAMENWVLQRTKSINVQKRCDKSKCKVISNFIVWVLDLRFLKGSEGVHFTKLKLSLNTLKGMRFVLYTHRWYVTNCTKPCIRIKAVETLTSHIWPFHNASTIFIYNRNVRNKNENILLKINMGIGILLQSLI